MNILYIVSVLPECATYVKATELGEQWQGVSGKMYLLMK